MKYNHLFGPVPSRRLGMSLGIDLVPKKICSLNCVYCEVGKTTKLTVDRKEYVSKDAVLKELELFLSNKPKIDFITFSGSGEPTLNNKIGEILDYIKTGYPEIKTAVLTNGTLFFDKKLRDELHHADVILPSLDAASDKVFSKINRPHYTLDVEQCIQSLIALRQEFKKQIWLEVFLLKGYNDHKEELDLLKNAITRINPNSVQLNTLDRPGVVENLLPLSDQELREVIKYWNLSNIEIIAPPLTRTTIGSYTDNIESAILEIISRRPCTINDLQSFLGIHINEINKYLSILEARYKIKTITLQRGVFYTKTEEIHKG